MFTIVGCASKSGQDKGVYFARVPFMVTNKGKKVQKFSRERRPRWILGINRDDLTTGCVEGTLFLERLTKAGIDVYYPEFFPLISFVQFPRKETYKWLIILFIQFMMLLLTCVRVLALFLLIIFS